jgi:ABC-type Mn2+/Zn2+ transport system permease subunit
MNTPTSQQIKKTETASRGDTVLGLVVLGLLAAGVVGILKATSMESGFDVMLCLFGSVAAFGGVYYILFGKQ